MNPGVDGNHQIRKIDLEGIVTKIEYQKTTLVCYILGAYPPFSVLNGFNQRMGDKLAINKITIMKNGIILVCFEYEKGRNEKLQVKALNHDMEFSREKLYSTPIWVRLPGLDFKYWSAQRLSKIGSLVDNPLMVDKNTERKILLLVKVKIGATHL